LETYRRDGCVLVENLLSPAELQQTAAVIPAVSDRLLEKPDTKAHIFEKDASGQPIAVRCIHNLLEQDPIFKKFAAAPRIVSIVKQIMSPRPLFYRGIVVMKKGEVGSAFPWHQDFSYWGTGKPELVGVWIALKDATLTNGCLEIIRGSHRWGVLPMLNNDPGKPILTPEQEAQSLPVPVKAGGALFFHSLLVHRSQPNRTQNDRWAMIFEYSAPEFENQRHPFDRMCGWDLSAVQAA
jgi:ectoine hydroxylase-related dioxygenase (phytanoyl-CoA dioxygenase family)